MKKRYAAMLLAATWPLLLLTLIPFMPESFPWQYNGSSVSRFGSRLELLIYAAIPVFIGWGSYFWARKEHKNENKNFEEPIRNERFIITLTTIGLAALEALIIWIMIKGFQYTSTSISTDISPILRLIVGFFGLLLIVYGNQMPRASYKSALGVKTMWSMDNDEAWIYTQRWSGILFVLLGFGIIIYTVLNSVFSGLILLITVLGLVAGSYLLSFIALKKHP